MDNEKKHTDNDSTVVDDALNYMRANLGAWLKEQRDSHGKISGRELARKSQVSSAVISDLECFKYLPKMEVLLKLISVLKISVKDMLDALWTEENEKSWKRYVSCDGEMFSTSTEHCYASPLFYVEEILREYGLTHADIDDAIEFIKYKKFKSDKKRTRMNNKLCRIDTDCHENNKNNKK